MTYGSGYEPKIFFACGGPNLMFFPFRVEVLYLSGARPLPVMHDKEECDMLPCHVGGCMLLLGVALARMVVGCVLVCSTFKGRRVHCKHERAANANLGSHSLQRQSDALRTSC